MDGSQTVQQVRFDWDKNAKDPGNHEAIRKVVAFMHSHGAQYSSEATPTLTLINTGDLHARVVTKFDALRRIWRDGKKKERAIKPDNANAVQEPVEPVEVNKRTAAEIRKYANWARGVSSLTVSASGNRGKKDKHL